MKEFFAKRFASKSIGFYLGLASAALMLVADIVFVGMDSGDRTFSLLVFLLNLFGALVWVAYAFVGIELINFLPVVSCVLYGVAFGQHLFLTLESLSDVWNGVNFVGGNAMLALGFAIVFAVGMICSIASCFMRENKKVKA